MLKEIKFWVTDNLRDYDDTLLCDTNMPNPASIEFKDDENNYRVTAEITMIGRNVIRYNDEKYYDYDSCPDEIKEQIKSGTIWDSWKTSDNINIDESINMYLQFNIYDANNNVVDYDSDPFERAMSGLNEETAESLHQILIEYAKSAYDYYIKR